LRAAGASWDAVADRLHRSPDTCRRWPARFPAAWADLYRQAERRLAAEARAEATNVLRVQLRHEDDKAKRPAPTALLSAAARRRDPEPDSSADPLTEFLSSLPPDHVPDVTAACHRALDPDRAD